MPISMMFPDWCADQSLDPITGRT